ncbi:hypothetical protein CDL15_Pgr012711 [Punica granatum]|nr:hypothetical protein CDL15_Pgr012711 [Punica granatum]
MEFVQNRPDDHDHECQKKDKNNTADHVIVIMDQQNRKLHPSPLNQSDPINNNSSNNIDPIPPTPSRAKIVPRLNFSKPTSRFGEVVKINSPKSAPEYSQEREPKPSPDESSSSSEDNDGWYDDEDDEKLEGIGYADGNHRRRKLNKTALLEWFLFLTIMTCLICSLALHRLRTETLWGLKMWKWCLMVMVVFCGRLVSEWLVGFIVFLIERNFMLREKVLYFVYGLRKSFQNCAWLALILVAWVIMSPNVHKHHKVLKKLFRTLVAVLIGATIWLLKIVLVKVLASSFHVTTFFDRMKESVFHHYILDTLSGPPLDKAEREQSKEVHRRLLQQTRSLPPRLGSRRIDMERLKKLSLQQRASARSVRQLVSYIRQSGLSTISRTVDDFSKAESEINSEWKAWSCAQQIFKNVAKPGAKYIEEEDLLNFLKREEVHTLFPTFEGALETGRITKSSFRNWVVHAYFERKALAHSLNDTKTAVQQLHKLASAIAIIVIFVVSVLVMGLATTKVVFVVTSQLLILGFMFQNTCKTIFESIIFVFVMHPFDVGDRCVIDDIQMVVEEMNILTTVFLRYDMEKIYYPNSVLLTKPISNFRRSPDMADSIDFTISVSTSIDDINTLKKAIQTYIESKPKHWNPKHSVIVKEIENVDKMKMALYVQHTMNHQNYGEKTTRRSDLILELKRIFENLGIKYHLLPQEVHLTQVNTIGRVPVLHP